MVWNDRGQGSRFSRGRELPYEDEGADFGRTRDRAHDGAARESARARRAPSIELAGAASASQRRAERRPAFGDERLDSWYDDASADEASRSQASYGRANYERRRGHAPGAKARRGLSTRAIALWVALGLALAGALAAFAVIQNLDGNLRFGLDSSLDSALVKTDMAREPFYMLLMGTDGSKERDGEAEYGGVYRTDSIMLMRVDPVNKKVALVSIHRDTMVDLGEHGMQKINAAHVFGGATLSVQTVSKMAGVPISHYAEINFDGFRDIVNALGGIDVNVPVDIDDSDAGGSLKAGEQTLNGDQALILCRSRHTYGEHADPDSMRAANQRLVLSAIARKMLASDPATIANTVTALSKHVTTDLGVTDIVGLAQVMRGLDPETDIYTAMEPVTSRFENGGWYTYTKKAEWKDMIARMNAGEPPALATEVDERTGTVTATAGSGSAGGQMLSTVSVKNGAGVTGLGDAAAARLKEAGFTNVTTGNAESFDYEQTVVVYAKANARYGAERIVEALGGGTAMLNDGNYLFQSDYLVVLGSDMASKLKGE
ncbi:LCP family protein [Eggerthellaceae bacterium zg-997]|nr:LCP family protein [Eggerthellaceae bacterium zg-997]